MSGQPQPSHPSPPPGHYRYLVASAMRNTVDTLDMVAVNAHKLIPGDSVTDYTRAWEDEDQNAPRQQLEKHIADIFPATPPAAGAHTDVHMDQEGLTGPTGTFKLNLISRLLDWAYRHLKPGKDKVIDLNLVTPQERKLGLEALGEYFEAMGTLIKSVFPSANAVIEFVSFTKQACKMAAKWL
jgi:hypothetical protein